MGFPRSPRAAAACDAAIARRKMRIMLDTGVVLEDTRDECDGMKANQIIMRQGKRLPPSYDWGGGRGKNHRAGIIHAGIWVAEELVCGEKIMTPARRNHARRNSEVQRNWYSN